MFHTYHYTLLHIFASLSIFASLLIFISPFFGATDVTLLEFRHIAIDVLRLLHWYFTFCVISSFSFTSRFFIAIITSSLLPLITIVTRAPSRYARLLHIAIYESRWFLADVIILVFFRSLLAYHIIRILLCVFSSRLPVITPPLAFNTCRHRLLFHYRHHYIFPFHGFACRFIINIYAFSSTPPQN